MFCPQCGQERVSQATSFCSRCGFLLTAAAELLETGGAPLAPAISSDSPRSRGIKLGLFLFFLTIVIAPIIGMISTFGFGIVPWPMGVVIFLLGGGGLLRIAYAMMFESKYGSLSAAGTDEQKSFKRETADLALPPTSFMPDSFAPPSVTDSTTKLLQKDEEGN